MMRLMILAAVVGLGACESTIDPASPAPATRGDVASYDAIRQATQACNASGGTLELRRNADPSYASSYVCRPVQRSSQ